MDSSDSSSIDLSVSAVSETDYISSTIVAAQSPTFSTRTTDLARQNPTIKQHNSKEHIYQTKHDEQEVTTIPNKVSQSIAEKGSIHDAIAEIALARRLAKRTALPLSQSSIIHAHQSVPSSPSVSVDSSVASSVSILKEPDLLITPANKMSEPSTPSRSSQQVLSFHPHQSSSLDTSVNSVASTPRSLFFFS